MTVATNLFYGWLWHTGDLWRASVNYGRVRSAYEALLLIKNRLKKGTLAVDPHKASGASIAFLPLEIIELVEHALFEMEVERSRKSIVVWCPNCAECNCNLYESDSEDYRARNHCVACCAVLMDAFNGHWAGTGVQAFMQSHGICQIMNTCNLDTARDAVTVGLRMFTEPRKKRKATSEATKKQKQQDTKKTQTANPLSIHTGAAISCVADEDDYDFEYACVDEDFLLTALKSCKRMEAFAKRYKLEQLTPISHSHAPNPQIVFGHDSIEQMQAKREQVQEQIYKPRFLLCTNVYHNFW